MPLKLSVGLSRKIGQANFGSRGASVHLELETDGSLAREPTRLRETIRKLFTLVRSSLDEELHRGVTASPQEDHARCDTSAESSLAKPGASNKARPATPSQVQALYGIARNQRLDLPNLLQHQFQVGRLEDLTVSQASRLLDTLLKAHRKTA